MPTRRILLHMPNWLGDVVMATPLLDHLARAAAAAGDGGRVDVAVRPAWAPLFRDDPRVGSLLPVERGGRHAGLGGLWRQGRELAAGGYAAVVLGPPSLRAGLVAALSRASVRVGHSGDGRDWLLGSAVARGPRGTRHHAWELLDLGVAAVADLGWPAPLLPDGDLPPPSLAGTAAWEAQPLPDERPLWVVAPGTTYGEAKSWPAARVAELVEAAVRDAGARVVFLGDAAAAPFAAALCSGSRRRAAAAWAEAADLVDLTGRTDLVEVVRVLRAATAFVGNDSGLMHVAGALGVPTVGVFGSSNPDWTRPLGPWTTAVTAAGFPCRPCYRRTCNQPEFCLATIGGAEVFAAACDLVARRGAATEERS
ncbi:lipopolysaccharide heptosyltransferase II [bacterium]|nr:lipopolysaccharide heptosyltransferase II [bacterium]